MIKISEVNKSYNGVKVLNNINISFREKEFVAILGPSGSGKSTLLNIISAIEKPDEGEMFLGTINIFKLKHTKQDYYRASYINYIFQNYNLINYLNVKDNLIISSKIKGCTTKLKIDKLLKKLGLRNKAKSYPIKLSGGEQQRLAIARSLLGNIKILLADEPTGALDSKNSIKIMKILKNLSNNKLVIMVTHNEELAKKYADRIIRIKDGNIINDTNPYVNEDNYQYLLKKKKLSLIKAIDISLKNLKNKKIRTYLTTLAFSIGLISLTLVLSISNGFNKQIKIFKENALYNYPLIISRERLDLNNAFSKKKNNYQDGIINISNGSSMLVTNEINNNLIDKISSIDQNLIAGISYYKDINSNISDYLYANPTNSYFEILSGKYPEIKNEVMLLLDNNKSINGLLANNLNIKEIKYEDILDKEIIINNDRYLISGVVTSSNNYFHDLSGVVYNSSSFDEEIKEIFIFPKDYQSKESIKESLKDYNLVDDSETVVNMTKSFVTGIGYVLVSFSIISLIVSIIMIAIITYISVLERYREIGILKSLGVTSGDIKKLFLSENLIIGLLSSLITLEINSLISKVVNKYINSQIGIENIVMTNSKIILFIIILSISLTYVAGLIPANIAGKKKIIDILKYE